MTTSSHDVALLIEGAPAAGPAGDVGLARLILDALPSNVALVDASGAIVAVNAAWEDFGRRNGGTIGVGADYLGVCDVAAAAGLEDAREAAHLVRAALAGDARPLRTTYPCHAPHTERWFELRCSPLRYGGSRLALVKHADVTDIVLGARAVPADLVETVVRAGAARFEVPVNGGGPEAALRSVLAPGGRSPVDEEGLDSLLAVAQATLADRAARTVPHRLQRTDGEAPLWAETRLEMVDERTLRGTVRDVGARRALQDELRLRGAILDAVGAAVIATDAEGVVTEWNATAEGAYGWSRAEALGRSIHELPVMPADRAMGARIMRAVGARGGWEGRFGVAHRSGRRFMAEVRLVALRDPSGAPAGMVGSWTDVSERTASEHEARVARETWSAVSATMTDGVLTLDGAGLVHALNPAAEALLGWSQDELVGQDAHVVLHRGHPRGRRCPLAAAMGTIVDDVFLCRDGTALPVSYAATPLRSVPGERAGRIIVFHDARPERERRERRRQEARNAEMVARIRRALRHDDMVLFAQPIVDCGTREVHQHELLIRMREEDGRIVAPGEFLPVAEQYGLIREIDRWVVREAARLAAAGHAVELNLSAESIGNPAMLPWIAQVIAETGAQPSRMVIELTETALLRDEDVGGAFIEGVRALGCLVALDDFGTGYGGFHYLKRFPIDYLKIDREFVRDLCRDAASRHVVRAVVNLADAFGLRTIAEGVEDAETLELLGEFGVNYAQGYHIRRPKPAERALAVRPTEGEEESHDR